ncbi:MAG: VanW family protein [Clostridia bacterium]|nr:VanW family protein [Clostridia bacterium]
MCAKKKKKSVGGASFVIVMLTGVVLLGFMVIWLIGELKNLTSGGTPGSSDSLKDSTTLPPVIQTTAPIDVVSVVEGYIGELLSTKEIKITANGESVTLNAGLAKAPVDYEELRNFISSRGGDSSLVGRYLTVMATQGGGAPQFNSNYISDMVDRLAEAADKGVDTSYEVTEEGVRFVRGTDHTIVDADDLVSRITDALSMYDYSDIEAKTVSAKPIHPDVDAIRNEIYYPAVDAHYDTEYFEGTIPNEGMVGQRTIVVKESNGRDIDTAAILNGLENESWDNKTYPYIVLEPSIVEAQVGEDCFKDLLGSYTTTYSTSNKERTANVLLASEAVNGVIILPGNKFSFNDIVGERTPEKGYQPALIYTIEGMEPDYGGGICQVVSTIYAASLNAGLKQTQRYNHGYTVSYIKLGIDATVAWPYTDYRFRNDTDYPIKVVVTNSNGRLKVDIYGTATGGTRRVEFKMVKLEDLIPNMTEVVDPSLAPGKRIVPKFSYGYVIETYMLTYIDNQLVSEVKLHTDTYSPYPKNIEVRVGPSVTDEPVTE